MVAEKGHPQPRGKVQKPRGKCKTRAAFSYNYCYVTGKLHEERKLETFFSVDWMAFMATQTDDPTGQGGAQTDGYLLWNRLSPLFSHHTVLAHSGS